MTEGQLTCVWVKLKILQKKPINFTVFPSFSSSFSWTIESDSDHISCSSTGANVDLQMCLYKPGTTKKHKSLISQLLSPFGHPPSLWTLSCELRAPSSTGTRRGNTTWYCSIHWVFKITMRSVAFARAKKISWSLSKSDGLICLVGGLTQSPCIQVTHRARSLSSPSQHIQPEPSIACLTWHIITVEIFVYFVRVPQSALQPTAKSSQLPLQLSQPESLIKTRCFHLGQLWKKSLPESGLALPNPILQ